MFQDYPVEQDVQESKTERHSKDYKLIIGVQHVSLMKHSAVYNTC